MVNDVQYNAPRPDSAPMYPHRLARFLWLCFLVAISITYWFHWQPGHAQIAPGRVLPVPVALAASAVLAYGLAAVAALVWVNYRRWKTVLWPIRSKFLGAFALTFVTPLAVFSGIPWIVGGFMLLFIGSGASAALGSLMALIAGTLLWYPVSALIICGTRSKWLRFGLFCLMFWSTYCAHVLVTGWKIFQV